MDITEISILHHVCIVLLALWGLSKFDCCYTVAYFISLVYLYLVHDGYVTRLRKKVEFEERKKSNQRRVLTDSETVRWLNHAIEKIWPICMENIASQKFLYPIIPWFLEKYKPWTAKQAMVQHLYLGRNPPIFTEMRVLRQGSDDDHLVMELGMNFLTAEDMSAIIAVQLRKRLGGMWTKLHITGMHVEGKVLIGVKFIPVWPFLARLRVCFAEPPYFQMTVKPLSTHGIDVTEVPGIAGWLDKLLSIAFEQTLVEPNMLVVDVTKFAEPEKGNWFSVDVKDPVAHLRVEIIEAANMKPSDLNGLADPYVKGQLGPFRFKTKVQKKTLYPKWLEEFRIPIVTREGENELKLEVCDKDHIFDDSLGKYSINIKELQVGERQDMWVALQNVKLGRLHIALTVEETGNSNPNPQQDQIPEEESHKIGESSSSSSFKSVDRQGSYPSNRASFSSRGSFSSRVADKLYPIDIDGQKETGIWACEPGSEISQTWEPRKGKSRRADTEILGEQTDPKNDENPEGKSSKLKDGFRKLGSMFHRSPKEEHQHLGMIDESEAGIPSSYINVKEVGSLKMGVNYMVERDGIMSPKGGTGAASPRNGKVKEKAKNFFKHVLSRKDSRKGDSRAESESDSTEEDAFPPSLGNNNSIPIASQPISTIEYGDGDSCKLRNLENSLSVHDCSGVELDEDLVEVKHAIASTVASEGKTPKG